MNFVYSGLTVRFHSLMADVDKTVNQAVNLSLAQPNLGQAVRGLEMGKNEVYISGSPYFENDGGVHFGPEALGLKLAGVLREELTRLGEVSLMAQTKYYPASGRDEITFDVTGAQNPVKENKNKFIPHEIQVAIAQSLAAGFYAVKHGIKSLADFLPISANVRISQLICESSEEMDFNRFLWHLLKKVKLREDLPATKFGPFKSELVLNFPDAHIEGRDVINFAEQYLAYLGVTLPADDYFRSYGSEYAKFARIRKLETIRAEVVASYRRFKELPGNADKPFVVLGLGDGRADDFVYMMKPEDFVPLGIGPGEFIYFPIYFGKAEEVAENSDVYVTRFRDPARINKKVEFFGFAPVMRIFMDLEVAGRPFSEFPFEMYQGQKTFFID